MKNYICRFYFLTVFTFIFISCSSETVDSENQQEDETEETQAPNILLIIADDMGLDASPGYNIGTTKPNMPNLESLISTGIRFNNVWSNPTCTPTRAGLLTGKYGFRTNVVKVDDPLSTSETSIQKYLDDQTNMAYNHAVIGKWHLSRDLNHPNAIGINYFAGFRGGGLASYTNWNLNTNGNSTASSIYTTTKFTDLAINWVDNQTKPWFLWVAYNAPHTPFHLPPTNLHTQGALPTDQTSIENNPLPYYLAALEAIDTEMGRLINSLSQEERDNTIIIFIGDNGTPNEVKQEYTRAKGTLYQGGINVPMIISGKGVTKQNQTEDALIHTLDIFATVADLAKTGTTEINDSKSFKALLSGADSHRKFVFTEDGNEDGSVDMAIRNNTHKYILFENGTEALYDLSTSPMESPNLLHENQLPLSNSNNTIKNLLASELQNIVD